MAKERVPESVKHPLSLQADYAHSKRYGGAAFVAGLLGLILAFAILVVESWTTATIVAGLAFLLLGVGYWMYTRAH